MGSEAVCGEFDPRRWSGLLGPLIVRVVIIAHALHTFVMITCQYKRPRWSESLAWSQLVAQRRMARHKQETPSATDGHSQLLE